MVGQERNVAVLMATYNGAAYVGAQIESLRQNSTPFTLNWIDDHSSDDTRAVVRETALQSGVTLIEWHQPQRQGYPRTFLQLLEDVDADIYLFCDQDDIWQPGKIDAAVSDLLPDVDSPTLSYSDPLLFWDDDPTVLYPWSKLMNFRNRGAVHGPASLILCAALGQSIGLTRPLRDLYLRHKDVARANAEFHSLWMFQIANATGTSRALDGVPSTLYRQHGKNATALLYSRARGVGRLRAQWRRQQALRVFFARQARGFMLAAPSLPPGPKRDDMVALAPLVATFDRRQPLSALLHLWRRGGLPVRVGPALWMAASCLCCDAKGAPASA
jgi:hypothetical protein